MDDKKYKEIFEAALREALADGLTGRAATKFANEEVERFKNEQNERA